MISMQAHKQAERGALVRRGQGAISAFTRALGPPTTSDVALDGLNGRIIQARLEL
jgi:hypothetical protein